MSEGGSEGYPLCGECVRSSRFEILFAFIFYAGCAAKLIEYLAQDQGHQHPLLEAVQRSLGMPREQQPEPMGVPEARDGAQQLCF